MNARPLSDDDRRRLSGPGLRTFLSVADLWRLSDDERRRILGATPADYAMWTQRARERSPLMLESDTLLRAAAVLGIYKALRNLHAAHAGALEWPRTPHQAAPFNGRPPLELVVDGRLEALLACLRFLCSAEQGLYMPPQPSIDAGPQSWVEVEIDKGKDG